jgi:hypothetical protein
VHPLLEVQIGVQDRPASAPPPSATPTPPEVVEPTPKRLSFTPELIKLELQNLSITKPHIQKLSLDLQLPILHRRSLQQMAEDKGVDFLLVLFTGLLPAEARLQLGFHQIHLIKKKTEFARFLYVAQ